MKIILILILTVTVSAGIAQNLPLKLKNVQQSPINNAPGRNILPVKPEQTDTTNYIIKFRKETMGLLLQMITDHATRIKRSPDITALRADEMAKTDSAMARNIYQQLVTQFPKPASFSKKDTIAKK